MTTSSPNEESGIKSPEDAVYKALAAGRYCIFVARLDHLGEGGFNTYMRFQDLPAEDLLKCPSELSGLIRRGRDKVEMEREFENALSVPLPIEGQRLL